VSTIRLLPAIALILAMTSLSWADYQTGAAAFTEGDYTTALRELEPLAVQGDASAQFLLGVMYGIGEQVRQDYAESFRWFHEANLQGHAAAQLCLGMMYREGKGTEQNLPAAVKWFGKAADQGNANAQFVLGEMYRTGEGVRKDPVQAHVWFNLAAIRGRKDAAEARDSLARKMTSRQIAQAHAKARNWKRSSQKNPAR